MLQLGATQTGPAGQVAGGIGATGAQVTQQRLGRALDTRPTITVASGQLCQVLLTKPLTLPALWQYGGPGVGPAGLRGGRGGGALGARLVTGRGRQSGRTQAVAKAV